MNETVKAYFDAFNNGDTAAMLACLSDDVAHHVNEGQVRVGNSSSRFRTNSEVTIPVGTAIIAYPESITMDATNCPSGVTGVMSP